MNLKTVFQDNARIQATLGHKLNKIADVQMTSDLPKATPIIEILEKLDISINYKNMGAKSYLENNNKIVINNFDNKYRQRFAMAFLLSQKLNPEGNTAQHNAFASDLLLPEKNLKIAIIQYLGDDLTVDSHRYQKLTKYLSDLFLIGQEAVNIKLHQLEIITD